MLIASRNITKIYLNSSISKQKIIAFSNFNQIIEEFEFYLENYKIFHHEFIHKINIDVRYRYINRIDDSQYPDFLKLEQDIKQFLNNYHNDTDYWEIVNKKLAKLLFDKYQQFSFLAIKIYVFPDKKVKRSRSSIVTLSR
jgi:hypothetical protein